MRHSFHRAGAAIVALAMSILPGIAGTYPDKPIHLIVPTAPGGSLDAVARIMANEIGERLGQIIVVENRAGAGGNIGNEAAARSAPDGYTLLMASSPLAVNVSLYKDLKYDPLKDFTPLSLVALQPQVLVVNPGMEMKTVQDVIDYAKANPGKLNYGSAGVGNSQHLAAELFEAKTGVDMVHVPYRGGGPAMTDLVGGRLQLMFEPIPSAMGYIQSNRLRAIAVTVKDRVPALPDVPTIAESGIPDYSVSGWLSVMGPAGLPPDIAAKLSETIQAAARNPKTREQLTKLGLQVVGSTPEEFSEFLKGEVKFYKKLISDAHITLN